MVDLVLRRRGGSKRECRETHVKYGRLWTIGPENGHKWERPLFDRTSWRFFHDSEFAADGADAGLLIAYVLAGDEGYRGDIFIFAVHEFMHIVRAAIPVSGGAERCTSRAWSESSDRSCVAGIGSTI
ncbi:MAG TPA: hypothetical protein VEK11_24435 [Thermoanaerobaculia bacterium]|nr:hypothetical protein [Thermoanaerobaculia bacterium]